MNSLNSKFDHNRQCKKPHRMSKQPDMMFRHLRTVYAARQKKSRYVGIQSENKNKRTGNQINCLIN